MLPVYEAAKGVPIMGIVHDVLPALDVKLKKDTEHAVHDAAEAAPETVEYVPAGQDDTHEEIDPVEFEYFPATHNTHDTLDVLKYEPAAQGANAVRTTSPLPPFPALDAWPGNPPTPTMLYVLALPEEVPEEPAWVKAEPSWMQPPI